jgi:hypothetical protein
MKKPFLAALIAATALVPAVASAQDRHRGREARQNDSGQNREGQRQWRQESRSGDRGDRQARPEGAPRGNWRSQQPAAVAAPAPAPQQQQQFRRDRSQWNGGQQGQQTRRGNWNGGQQAQQPQQAPQQQFRRDRGQANGAQVQQRGEWRGRGDGDRGDRNRNWQQGQQQRRDWRGNNNNWRGDRAGNNNWRDNDRGDNRRWSNSWRRDGRYNWRGYRNSNRNIFRMPRYYAPHGYGYGYRRFSIGVTLGALLFSQNYWIDDPFYYRLPPAYGQYRWVRYYNDALLVDIYTGEVVDVEYDIFW